MKFSSIFVLLFAPIFAFIKNPNVYFTFFGTKNVSIIRISYKLNVIENSSFLQLIESNYNTFLYDLFVFSGKNQKYLALFDKSDGNPVQTFSLLDKIDRKTSRQMFKFPISQTIIRNVSFCRKNWSCYGKIIFLNLKLMDQYMLNNYEHPEIMKYSRIDALLNICISNGINDSQEICDDEYTNIYLFGTISLICLVFGTLILYEIAGCYKKWLRKRTAIGIQN